MIPFSITIDEAAAPHSSLAFMFWGAGLFVFPLMLLYTAINYSVFRGTDLGPDCADQRRAIRQTSPARKEVPQ